MKDFDMIGYLNLIQNNISRMAGNSAIMKGFSATVITAIIALEHSDLCLSTVVLCGIVLMAFVVFDTLYLQLERKYRNLYNEVAEGNIPIYKYYMDLNNSFFDEYRSILNQNCSFWQCLISKSILSFYACFLLCIIVLTINIVWC